MSPPREQITTVTGADGSFHGNALLAGTYTVLIAKAGFKQLLVENAPVKRRIGFRSRRTAIESW